MKNRLIISGCLAMLLPLFSYAQLRVRSKEDMMKVKSAYPLDWHKADFNTDKLYGAAITKAYAELLKGKQPQRVVVAIMDSGLDTDHEDLKNVLWTNAKEIPGNGIDDDHNGYVDDIHGWNFVASPDGQEITNRAREADREYVKLTKLYDGTDTTKLKFGERSYLASVKADSKIFHAENNLEMNTRVAAEMLSINKQLQEQHGGGFTYQDYDLFKSKVTDPIAKKACNSIDLVAFYTYAKHQPADALNWLPAHAAGTISNSKKQLMSLVESVQRDKPAKAVNGKMFGNARLNYSSSIHGTHVGGIIGAERGNQIGIEGIAKVELMGIRVVPSGGDEYDEDVAQAIRYAVDNGANIINMSFGKLIAPNKKAVDDALKYAEAKNVLIVHAAGNDGKNTDGSPFYPSAVLNNGYRLQNVVTVGGSDFEAKIAGISNYGKKSVDLFAPSHSIYSTGAPGMYMLMDGTSVSAPVVTGIAAMLKSYYPNLTAKQIRNILIASVTPVPAFAGLSVSGGIVNAYQAVKMAQTIK